MKHIEEQGTVHLPVWLTPNKEDEKQDTRVAAGYPGCRRPEFLNPNGVGSRHGILGLQPRWGCADEICFPKVGAPAPTLGCGPERLWRSFSLPRTARNSAKSWNQYGFLLL